MADEADSKSVVGNHVWVQVPSPALSGPQVSDAVCGDPLEYGIEYNKIIRIPVNPDFFYAGKLRNLFFRSVQDGLNMLYCKGF